MKLIALVSLGADRNGYRVSTFCQHETQNAKNKNDDDGLTDSNNTHTHSTAQHTAYKNNERKQSQKQQIQVEQKQ